MAGRYWLIPVLILMIFGASCSDADQEPILFERVGIYTTRSCGESLRAIATGVPKQGMLLDPFSEAGMLYLVSQKDHRLRVTVVAKRDRLPTRETKKQTLTFGIHSTDRLSHHFSRRREGFVGVLRSVVRANDPELRTLNMSNDGLAFSISVDPDSLLLVEKER